MIRDSHSESHNGQPRPRHQRHLLGRSSTIAGFQLGMTLAQASAACNGQLQGTPVDAVCPFAPVRVPFAAGDVHLELDAGIVTSVRFHARSWAAARDALTERYGAPAGFAVEVNGRWINAKRFDRSRNSVALWQTPVFDILAISGSKGIDVKYILTGTDDLRAAAY